MKRAASLPAPTIRLELEGGQPVLCLHCEHEEEDLRLRHYIAANRGVLLRRIAEQLEALAGSGDAELEPRGGSP